MAHRFFDEEAASDSGVSLLMGDATPWDDSSVLEEFLDEEEFPPGPWMSHPPTGRGDSHPAGSRRRGPRPGRSQASLEQQRSWFLTWNNPTTRLEPDQDPLDLIRSLPHLKRAVVGAETAPTTGTKHLQGFVRFSAPKRRWWVEERLPGVWLEKLESEQAAAVYAAKEKLVLDFGSTGTVVPENAYALALRGDLEPILSATTASWQFQNLQRLRQAASYGSSLVPSKSTRRVPFTIWLYGEAGAGKSSFATQLLYSGLLPETSPYALSNPAPGKSTWWDGFTPSQKIVLMDDLRATTMSSGNFCQAISNLPYRVDAKNVTMEFSAWLVVVTAPVPPWRLWSLGADEGEVDQVNRRVNLCAEFLFADSPQNNSYAPASSCTSWIPPLDIAARGSVTSVKCVPEVEKWSQLRAKRLAPQSRLMKIDWCDMEHWIYDEWPLKAALVKCAEKYTTMGKEL